MKNRNGESIVISRHCCFFVCVCVVVFWCSFALAEIRKHPSTAIERVVLSLQAVSKHFPKTKQDTIVNTLGGLGWIEGFVIDRINDDILIFGRTTVGWPSLTLDDLVVSIRNIWNREHYPYVSLDPLPKNIRQLNTLVENNRNMTSVGDMKRFFAEFKDTIGPQMVVVGGVSQKSHHAAVMLSADYHMKKLSQGLVTLDGIPSIIDLTLSEAKQAVLKGRTFSSGASMARLWFHIAQGHPTYKKGKDIILLEQCSVAVLTAKQRATRDGVLVDSGDDDLYARMFAKRLSEEFQGAATSVPSYAKLENLYRLQALLKAMYVQESVPEVNLDLSFFLQRYQYRYEYSINPSFPGLVNGRIETISMDRGSYKQEATLFPMVAGGVSMEIPLSSPKQLRADKSQSLKDLRKKIISSRPNAGTIFWKFAMK